MVSVKDCFDKLGYANLTRSGNDKVWLKYGYPFILNTLDYFNAFEEGVVNKIKIDTQNGVRR